MFTTTDTRLEWIMPEETDASLIGIGTVLWQNGTPIAYLSKNYTEEKKNYGITQRKFSDTFMSHGKATILSNSKRIYAYNRS